MKYTSRWRTWLAKQEEARAQQVKLHTANMSLLSSSSCSLQESLLNVHRSRNYIFVAGVVL